MCLHTTRIKTANIGEHIRLSRHNIVVIPRRNVVVDTVGKIKIRR